MSYKTSTHNGPESLPWYRVGMVWLVILLPLTVVIASMFTIALAHKHAPDLIINPTDSNTAGHQAAAKLDTRQEN